MREFGIRCQIRKKKHNRIKQNEQYIQDNLLDQFEVELSMSHPYDNAPMEQMSLSFAGWIVIRWPRLVENW